MYHGYWKVYPKKSWVVKYEIKNFKGEVLESLCIKQILTCIFVYKG